MNSQVLVVANKETGEVVTIKEITDSRNGEVREIGTIMVQSKSLTNFGGGIARVATRTAFVTMELEAIEFLGAALKAGSVFPQAGKIVIKETLVPYIRKNGTPQEPKMNPETKEIMLHNGQPIYRNVDFTDNLDAQDVFIVAGNTLDTEDAEVVLDGEEGEE